jgi:S1-C subfamily serine protease
LAFASVFAVGAGAGALLTAAHYASRSDLRPASEVVRVGGLEDAASKPFAPDHPPDARGPAQAARAPSAPPPSSPASGRAVAEAGLAVTAAIRGERSYGAGIVIGPRHVLTCLHVVQAMPSIELSVAEGASMPARLVAKDAELDLAVLELEAPQAVHARLASTTTARMGDRVFAMGAPKKMTFSLNGGIVSYVGRRYDGLFYLQTDIPTNPGNSGGPVLDEEGRVIAVASFILRETQGLAFAVPIDYAYQRFAQYFADSLDTRPFSSWLSALDERQQANETLERRPTAH